MSKVDTIKSKYLTIRDTTFDTLVNGDFTPTKKFLDRMCYYWTTKGNNKLLVKTLIQTIKDFEDHLTYITNKDIYSKDYDDYKKLVKVVEEAKNTKFEKEFRRDEHIEVIYESDEFLALSPKTFKGSLKYGANTRWCTAGKGYESTFKSYIKSNHLIYIIDKKNNNASINKIALLQSKSKGIESIINSMTEFYNPNDTGVQLRWFINNGWDEDNLVKILSHIRLYLYKKDKFRLVKDNVDNTINLITSINLNELINNINILKNIDIIDDSEMNKHKKTIDDFVSKITEISKTY